MCKVRVVQFVFSADWLHEQDINSTDPLFDVGCEVRAWCVWRALVIVCAMCACGCARVRVRVRVCVSMCGCEAPSVPGVCVQMCDVCV